jgi:hypothetical protein
LPYSLAYISIGSSKRADKAALKSLFQGRGLLGLVQEELQDDLARIQHVESPSGLVVRNYSACREMGDALPRGAVPDVVLLVKCAKRHSGQHGPRTATLWRQNEDVRLRVFVGGFEEDLGDVPSVQGRQLGGCKAAMRCR